jgi:hypothetical protein
MPRKRLRTRQKGREGIKDLGGRRPLYLRKKRTTTDSIGGRSSGQRSHLGRGGTLMKDLYEIVRVTIAKRIAGSYVPPRKIKDWSWWRGSAPSETFEEPTSNVSVRGAGDVGAPATWDSSAPTVGR